ncbi:MAG TPA: hypothetical protein VFF98_17285 [Novosphingobium sp.]|nr:hypothetical protein [Novosphingobium sp.]HZV09084.1 hypothetical protein [Novosphingobium sp.]
MSDLTLRVPLALAMGAIGIALDNTRVLARAGLISAAEVEAIAHNLVSRFDSIENDEEGAKIRAFLDAQFSSKLAEIRQLALQHP